MRSLFRSFERFGVEYLLVGGQASIAYGAATFSEDVDIWVRPESRNVRRLLKALAALRARVYKLTPPLTRAFLLAGHGFHFEVPGRPLPIYLDVLGRPPRVGPFGAARARARRMATGMGRLPIVSIEDLVALKLTRRLSDYEVISNLVLLRLDEEAAPDRAILKWAARHSFRAEDRRDILRRLGATCTLAQCRRRIAAEVVALQARDTAYWRRRIGVLRRLRQADRLLPQGVPVARLVAP
jgi:hypothetical protein